MVAGQMRFSTLSACQDMNPAVLSALPKPFPLPHHTEVPGSDFVEGREPSLQISQHFSDCQEVTLRTGETQDAVLICIRAKYAKTQKTEFNLNSHTGLKMACIQSQPCAD